jgi:hypothetical protein
MQGRRAVASFVVSIRKRAFTFIELFMVIGGIAMLLGLFLQHGDLRKVGLSTNPVRPIVLAVRLALLVALLVLVGCSSRRIPVPAFAPDRASKEALTQYDRNKDGFLDPEELKSCPALWACLKSWDTDKDGRLSGAEISARITAYQSSRIGLSALAFQVTLDGQPLAGATVTLIPEKFLGDVLLTAAGTTDARGRVCVAIPSADMPGVACGLYRIEVSKKDAFGRETISPLYNQATILVLEVAPDTNLGALCFALYSSMRP